jgi:phage baseplate assembly protein V
MDRHQTNATDRRVQLMISRGTIAGVDDAAQAQELQLDLLADETHDGVERFQQYGLTSVPLTDAEVVVAFPGGTRSHGIVLAVEDRRYRLRSMAPGEVALYDDQGQVVHLGRDGIRIASGKPVTIEAERATVIADRVDLGGEGGARVARVGDAVSGGVITGGSTKVFAA